MGWKHIVLEAFCLLGSNQENEQNPECCKDGPGGLGFHCIQSNDAGKICSFFRFGKARSTIVVTNEDGDEVSFQSFSSDDDIENESVWLQKESEWISNWIRLVSGDRR